MTKKGSSSGYESSHTYRERVSIGDFFVRGSVHFFFLGCSKDLSIFFFFSSFRDTLFFHCDSKPCIYVDIYIYDEVVIIVLSPISSCVVSFLSLCTCFLYLVCNLLFLFHTNMP